MAESYKPPRPILRKKRERTKSVPAYQTNDYSFSEDTVRRHAFLNPEFQHSNSTNDSKDKKHDVYTTLQETLEVLRDEAGAVARDSQKRDDIWCHPFEIPEHPIEQIEMKRSEIDLERQHSKIMRAVSLNDLDERMYSSKEGSRDIFPPYQRLTISGGNTSGVSLLFILIAH